MFMPQQPGRQAIALALCRGLIPLLLALALPFISLAKGSISSVDPGSVNQGDTVLLTIKGQDLPSGSVVVEFFPQQIAVLSLLSASESEIMLQIKVPPLAPPGKYNIIVYNQLGEEASADALFTVLSDLVTPVFRDYDPKVIAQAGSAFALVLSGEMVSRDAVEHLSILWTQGGQAVEGLESSFAYASPTAVSLAVTGTLPGGKLDGRVLLDEKPIYFLSIELPGARPEVYGHSPSRLPSGPDNLSFKLIGTGFSRSLLPRLSAKLVSVPPSRKVKAQNYNASLELLDEAALSMQCSPAPEGPYTLQLQLDGAPLYSGEVTLLPPGTDLPEEDAGADFAAESGGSAEIPQDLSPLDPPVLVAPEEDNSYTAPASGHDTALSLPLMEVEPSFIRPGESTRFTFNLDTLESYVLDRLLLSLEGQGWSETPVMQGTRDGNLVAVFELPQRDWQPADVARLRIVDPLGIYAAHNQSIEIQLEGEPEPGPELQPRPDPEPDPTISADDAPSSGFIPGPASGAGDNPAGFRPSHSSGQEPDRPVSDDSPAADDIVDDPAAGTEPEPEPELDPDVTDEPVEPAAGTAESAQETQSDAGFIPDSSGAGAVEVATGLPPAEADEQPADETQEEPQEGPEGVETATTDPQPEPSAANAEGEIYLLEEQLVLSDAGFVLPLATSLPVDALDWSRVQLDSENPLLAANTSRFSIRVAARKHAGRTDLELDFSPREGAFEAQAWDLLASALCSGEPVSMVLSWSDEAGTVLREAVFSVFFVRAVES